jgi:hypothetical protein
VNNDVARAAGLLAVAVLPALAGITQHAYEHPAQLSDGFHSAVLICAGLCAAGGLLSAAFVRGEPVSAEAARRMDATALQPRCAVDVPSGRSSVTAGCRAPSSVGAVGQPGVERGVAEPGVGAG